MKANFERQFILFPVNSKINSMQQKELVQLFNQYLVDKDFSLLESSYVGTSNFSINEYFINLSRISLNYGDNWSSFAFFLKAFSNNYLIKFMDFFNKDFFVLDKIDTLGQIGILLKSGFGLFAVLTFFIIKFALSQVYTGTVKKGLVLSMFAFVTLFLTLSEKASVALLKPQTSFLSSPSKVFFTGQLSGDRDVFLIVGHDKKFLKLINSKFEKFWVRREDSVIFK